MTNFLYKAKPLSGDGTPMLNAPGWVYGEPSTVIVTGYTVICYPIDADPDEDDFFERFGMVAVDPSTMCQGSDFTDINGNRIFEGDILDLGGIKVTVTSLGESYQMLKMRAKESIVCGNVYDKECEH